EKTRAGLAGNVAGLAILQVVRVLSLGRYLDGVFARHADPVEEAALGAFLGPGGEVEHLLVRADDRDLVLGILDLDAALPVESDSARTLPAGLRVPRWVKPSSGVKISSQIFLLCFGSPSSLRR